MRVIVCGSRTWTGYQATARLSGVLTVVLALAVCLDEDLTLVHGDCPQGADAAADAWARRHSPEVKLELFPADWTQGKSAGPRRNRLMVDSGADLVLAFQRDKSRGTQITVDLAEAAGIWTKTIEWDPRWSDAEALAAQRRQILATQSKPFGREAHGGR